MCDVGINLPLCDMHCITNHRSRVKCAKFKVEESLAHFQSTHHTHERRSPSKIIGIVPKFYVSFPTMQGIQKKS